MADGAKTDARSNLRQETDDFLAGLAPGLERLVNWRSFGIMVAQAASNAVALGRIGNEVMDLLGRARGGGRRPRARADEVKSEGAPQPTADSSIPEVEQAAPEAKATRTTKATATKKAAPVKRAAATEAGAAKPAENRPAARPTGAAKPATKQAPQSGAKPSQGQARGATPNADA